METLHPPVIGLEAYECRAAHNSGEELNKIRAIRIGVV